MRSLGALSGGSPFATDAAGIEKLAIPRFHLHQDTDAAVSVQQPAVSTLNRWPRATTATN